MKETIDILRRQLILCRRLEELLGEQKKILLSTSSGEAANEIAKQIEGLLFPLGKLGAEQRNLLASRKAESLAQLISACAIPQEKRMAADLLQKTQTAMQGLRKMSEQNHSLLDADMRYVSFNINVMSQATTGGTYASSGETGAKGRGQKIFDSSV